ncbi:ComEC/Rec2 family competence protein [Vibrio cyclitrophicus]|uniref:ComEC/Rec2 family competence protein n=1 Tax=Vibrio cyclitrophicus TaxID=47951 RepID=UPI00148D5C34|nr:MBL fold metallo-hydrolase [Vibrio cyclitrophicus]
MQPVSDSDDTNMLIRMHKADNGDCVSIETQSEFVLIDGGTAQSFETWKGQIIGQVEQINSLIITHIDNDHVNGIIKLLEHEDCPVIEQVIFNGAEQLFGPLIDFDEEDRRSERKLLALSEECSSAGDKDQVGSSEGTSLSYTLAAKNIKCNDIVNGESLYREKCSSFNIGSLKFTVIGPEKNSLSELKAIWKDKLVQKKIKPKIISKSYYDTFEVFADSLRALLPNNHQISSTTQQTIESLANESFDDDDSPTNKSSFSFLIESNGKRILYLGDCHVDVVISWLNLHGEDVIKVDAVKISHHGSQNNTSLELLKRIDCNKYLISTNGKSHGHPDLQTLARIALVNQSSETDIIINYEVDTIPSWFMSELITSYSHIKLSMNGYEVEL